MAADKKINSIGLFSGVCCTLRDFFFLVESNNDLSGSAIALTVAAPPNHYDFAAFEVTFYRGAAIRLHIDRFKLKVSVKMIHALREKYTTAVC